MGCESPAECPAAVRRAFRARARKFRLAIDDRFRGSRPGVRFAGGGEGASVGVGAGGVSGGASLPVDRRGARDLSRMDRRSYRADLLWRRRRAVQHAMAGEAQIARQGPAGARGLPRDANPRLYSMTLDEKKRLLKNYRGRRLLACRATDLIHDVIAAIGEDDGTTIPPQEGLPFPPTDMQKAEMQNSAANLLRMILLWNDGHVSPSKLQRF